MKSIESISVCGLGKLGACMAATFAARGFPVVGSRYRSRKDSESERGRTAGGRTVAGRNHRRRPRTGLRATDDPAERCATDASFFIPPSPSLPDGSFSNEYLLKAMQPVAQAVREAGKTGHIFVCSSTTTPGAVDGVLIPMLEKETGWKCGADFQRLLQSGVHRAGQCRQRIARTGFGADRRERSGSRRRAGSSFIESTLATNAGSRGCRSSARS